jgi:hypothetical protein
MSENGLIVINYKELDFACGVIFISKNRLKDALLLFLEGNI